MKWTLAPVIDSQEINKINSVIQMATSKGRDCKQDLKETKQMARCFDYMNDVMKGGIYMKAYKNFSNLTQNGKSKNLMITQSKMKEINRNMEVVAEYYVFFTIIYEQRYTLA
jgi:L-serine deaminase